MSNIYKYRFRFNAKHNTSFEVENIHVHTFEVVCYVKQEELNYNLVENQIKKYLKKFQGSYLNEKMDEIPIIENIAMKFYKDINLLAKEFHLFRLELSDKPIQTYIISEEDV